MKQHDIAAMDERHIVDPEFDYVGEDITTLTLAHFELREAGNHDWADLLAKELKEMTR